jgi:hypothetical protein
VGRSFTPTVIGKKRVRPAPIWPSTFTTATSPPSTFDRRAPLVVSTSGFNRGITGSDRGASVAIDTRAESAGLINWAAEVLGLNVSADQTQPLLAEEGVQEPEDVFVEDTVQRLLQLAVARPQRSSYGSLTANCDGARALGLRRRQPRHHCWFVAAAAASLGLLLSVPAELEQE